MDNITIQSPLSVTDLLRLGVVILFGAIIFLSFVYGTFMGWMLQRLSGKNDFHKEPTRLIGGLSILIIALVSNSPYIYGISLFIGGLLIASEKFMINLAAIFNSDRKSVHKISEQWTEANEMQVQEKQTEEAEEGAILDEIQQENRQQEVPASNKQVEELETKFSAATKDRLNKIRSVERLTLDYIENLVRSPERDFKRYIEDIDTSTGEKRIFDGIVIDRRSFRVLFNIEVIYRHKLPPAVLRISLRRVVERVKSSGLPMLITIVASDFDQWDKESLLKYKQTFKKKHPNVGIVFYKEIEGGLNALDEEDLLDMLKY